jgi:molybdopterin converting factor small subunit
MRVTVRLHATLRKYLPAGADGNAVSVELSPGATVADAVARLGIPPDHAKMMVSGGEHLERTSVLRDGQEVNLFPPLAGG